MAQPPQVDDDAAGPEVVKPDAVGQVCPECQEEIFPKGKQQVSAALAYHRQQAHGVAGKHSKAAKATRKAAGARKRTPPPQGGRVRTPRDVIRDVGDDLGGGGRGGGSDRPPTANQWEKALSKLFGYGSTFIASQLVDDDPRIAAAANPEAVREELVEQLSLTSEDAEALGRLPGRMFSRSKLNAKYGRTAIEAFDGLDVAWVLGEYLATMARYRRERRRMAAALETGWQPGAPVPQGPRPAQAAAQPEQAAAPYQPPPQGAPAPVNGAAHAGAPNGHTPGPVAGVVIGPDYVAQLRRERGLDTGPAPGYIAGAGPNGSE